MATRPTNKNFKEEKPHLYENLSSSDDIEDVAVNELINYYKYSPEQAKEIGLFITRKGSSNGFTYFNKGLDEILADYNEENRDRPTHTPFTTGNFIPRQNKRRILERVGAAFLGEEEVVEEETDEYYIPSSPYCFEKIYEKLAAEHKTNKPPPHEYVVNSRQIPKHFNIDTYYIRTIPHDHLYLNKDKSKKTSTPSRRNFPVYPYLLLLRTNNINYHMVLIKKNNPDIKLKLEIPRTLIDGGQYPISSAIKKKPQSHIIVWDVETYKSRLDDHFVPYAVAYSVLDLQNPFEEPTVHQFWGDSCIEDFLQHITEADIPANQLFAHNSGKFDTYFLLRSPSIEIIKEIYVSGRYRSLTFRYGNSKAKTFTAKDSYSWMSMSLESMNKATKNKYVKQDYDIGKQERKEDYEENKKDIQHYLKYDVLSLAESLHKFESWLKEINQSITTTLGAPSLALKHWMHTELPECLWCPKSPSVKCFQRQSVYGGRVIHQRKVGEDMICLDANSLYPSAMTYDYPIGTYTMGKISQFQHILNEKMHFIAEVTLNGNNIALGIVPHKETIKSGLTYPSNIFRGVYTSPDVYSALAAGYTIVEVHQFIYWKESRPIFKDFIETLYETRNKLKKQGNPAEQTYKLILNSFFGKFLERTGQQTKYLHKYPNMPTLEVNKPVHASHENYTGTIERLPNNQYRFRYKTKEVLKRPTYVGAFVLAYARAIMNKLYMNKAGTTGVIKPSDVYYGDTDSIYLPLSLIQNSTEQARNSCLDENKLGYLKNDYGPGVIVKKALFLDYKRYCLEKVRPDKETPDLVFKFNGFSFKETDPKETWKLYERMYKGEHVELPRQVWTRSICKGIIIEDNKMKMWCPAAKTNWVSDRAYSKDFIPNIPEREAYYENWLFESNKDGIKYILKKNMVLYKKPPYNEAGDIITNLPITNFAINDELTQIERIFDNNKKPDPRNRLLALSDDRFAVIFTRKELGEIDTHLRQIEEKNLNTQDMPNLINEISQIIAMYKQEKETLTSTIERHVE